MTSTITNIQKHLERMDSNANFDERVYPFQPRVGIGKAVATANVYDP